MMDFTNYQKLSIISQIQQGKIYIFVPQREAKPVTDEDYNYIVRENKHIKLNPEMATSSVIFNCPRVFSGVIK